jgi:hypothetical protein
MGNQRKVCYS